MRLLVLALSAIAIQAEIVDRIALSVGNQVITEGQILEEIRVTAFLNHKEPDLGAEQRKQAAERLLEQTLFKRDMEFSHFATPDLAQAEKMEDPVVKWYASPEQFQEDLKRRGITQEELRRHLWWQLTMLSYIEYRFRPAIQISEADIKQYYDKKSADWQRQGLAQIPGLAESHDEIETILAQERVDQAVDRWLGDARTQIPIIYRKQAQEPAQ